MSNNQDNKNTSDQIFESLVAFKNTIVETFNNFSAPVQTGIIVALSIFALSTILNLLIFGSTSFFVTFIVSLLGGLVRYHIANTEVRISNLKSKDDNSPNDGTNG